MNRKGFRDQRFDDLAAYALDALSPDEQRQVEDLLERSEEARRDLASLRETAAAIGMASPAAEPPAGLKERLLEAILAEEHAPAKLRVIAGAGGRNGGVAASRKIGAAVTRRRAMQWTVRGAAAGSIGALAAAIVLVVFFGMRTDQLQDNLAAVNSQLQQERSEVATMQATMTALKSDLASAVEQTSVGQQQVSRLAEANEALKNQIRDHRWVTYVTMNRDWDAPSWFRGGPETPTAQGQIIVSPLRDRGVLIVDGMPGLPEGYVYRLWLMNESSRSALADFTVNEAGYALVEFRLPPSLADFVYAVVTRESQAERQSPGIEVLSAPTVK
jgi:hypothetical protein